MSYYEILLNNMVELVDEEDIGVGVISFEKNTFVFNLREEIIFAFQAEMTKYGKEFFVALVKHKAKVKIDDLIRYYKEDRHIDSSLSQTDCINKYSQLYKFLNILQTLLDRSDLMDVLEEMKRRTLEPRLREKFVYDSLESEYEQWDEETKQEREQEAQAKLYEKFELSGRNHF